ncbi:penicillin-binding protein activator [Massilia sp. PAMC28688]|uniref:penicillin-binding protein activator n=1 Tax=Massilia sp. PAMC28688 TaxID=2861283 RepID=UPI001E5ECDC4|nr:penicillin-binding protein activator [Massilia sp. PAMC28688]
MVLTSGCSTPCDAPGRLCAPIEANTSAPAARTSPMPLTTPVAPAVPQASVQTMPVEMPTSAAPPADSAAVPIRIALILPLRSEALGAPADAVRAGFMAAYERDRAGFIVNLIETSDSSDEALDAYMAARRDNDIIVGPLARPAVTAVAVSGTVTKPTIALNHPDGRSEDNPIPPSMLIIGLSIEDEARQVANWAAAEQPGASALIISGTNAWQRRIASAFAQQWKQLGNTAQLVEVPGNNGYVGDDAVNQLKQRIDTDAPGLLFAALDADQLRQVRTNIGNAVPLYGTSSINPGRESGDAMLELEGMRLLDLPWHVSADNTAVMQYPRPVTRHSLDMGRLYALGIDAYRVAREVALRPNTNFQLDGVTGQLTVSFGPGGARFERVEPAVIYQAGSYKPAATRR